MDPVTAYAQGVLDGEIVAGRLVRLACARHMRDLVEGRERGLRWRPDQAEFVFGFFSKLLRHYDGKFKGLPFALSPFQQFIVGSLFGWVRADGTRRFQQAYIEIGKGAGKTPMCAGIGLYGLLMDDEPAAEIYAAATKEEQAKILWNDAYSMAEASPDLAPLLDFKVRNLAVLATKSVFRPVSSEHRGLDGKRVHMALVDELHEHPSAAVVDKMSAGFKARRQPLLVMITNSGVDRESVCWHKREYSRQVLEGLLDDDAAFAYICGLDACAECRAAGYDQPNPGCRDCDDWRDEAVWEKANPNLDITPGRDYLRKQVTRAMGAPSEQNTILRLNFCVWTQQATHWLDVDAWLSQPPQTPAEQLAGRPCYIGVDLSRTTDLTAVALLFPDADGGADVLMRFYMPEDAVFGRSRSDHVPYDAWVRDGWIQATPGAVVDYDYIRADITGVLPGGDVRPGSIVETYDVREVGVDPYNATQFSIALMADGLNVVNVRQGAMTLSAPAKGLERLVMARQFRHGDNPVLRWMAGNVAIESDAGGNIKPTKAKSTGRIDGIAAIVTGLSRMMLASGDGKSYYEDNRLFVL